jgi:hypothetical protein
MKDSQRKAMFANNQRIRHGIEKEIIYAESNEKGWFERSENGTTSPFSKKEALALSARFGSMKKALQRASYEVSKQDNIIEHGACTNCKGTGGIAGGSCARCGGVGSAEFVHGYRPRKFKR